MQVGLNTTSLSGSGALNSSVQQHAVAQNALSVKSYPQRRVIIRPHHLLPPGPSATVCSLTISSPHCSRPTIIWVNWSSICWTIVTHRAVVDRRNSKKGPSFHSGWKKANIVRRCGRQATASGFAGRGASDLSRARTGANATKKRHKLVHVQCFRRTANTALCGSGR